MDQPTPGLSWLQDRAIARTIDTTRTFTRFVALVVVLCVAVVEGILPSIGRSPRTDRAELARVLATLT